MSYITNQWVKMNPFEAAARLNELERENAALREENERLERVNQVALKKVMTKTDEVENLIAALEDIEFHADNCEFLSISNRARAAIDAARKEAQP